jgi:lysophospholipase L1-like esterase
MLKHARISRRILLPLALAISLLFAFVPAVLVATHAQSSSSHLFGPKQHYLALGDSLAYGFQPCLLTSPPTCSNTEGYVYDLFTTLKSEGTKDVTDLGCPSETSTTFITGVDSKCFNSASSQLATAVTFLQAHPGKVSPVTLDIGASDFVPNDFIVSPTGCTVSSTFSTDLATLDANLKFILLQLKDAMTVDGRVTGSIVMMNYYDPLQNVCQTSPQFIQDFQTFNTDLASDASGFATIVDVFTAFGSANTPYTANLKLCALTWFTLGCPNIPQTNDIHPNNTGYSVIASTFAAAIPPD